MEIKIGNLVRTDGDLAVVIDRLHFSSDITLYKLMYVKDIATKNSTEEMYDNEFVRTNTDISLADSFKKEELSYIKRMLLPLIAVKSTNEIANISYTQIRSILLKQYFI